MVVTDKNNLPFTARYYIGSISELQMRAPDMARVNTLSNANGHYILGTAP
jgi:hypothetical protein